MEMLILGIVIGGMLVAVLISLTTMSKINEYEEETQAMYKLYRELQKEYEELKEVSMNAEQRALIHFRKLQAIERILNQDEKTKEFAVFTVKKLKEVIQSPNMK